MSDFISDLEHELRAASTRRIRLAWHAHRSAGDRGRGSFSRLLCASRSGRCLTSTQDTALPAPPRPPQSRPSALGSPRHASNDPSCSTV